MEGLKRVFGVSRPTAPPPQPATKAPFPKRLKTTLAHLRENQNKLDDYIARELEPQLHLTMKQMAAHVTAKYVPPPGLIARKRQLQEDIAKAYAQWNMLSELYNTLSTLVRQRETLGLMKDVNELLQEANANITTEEATMLNQTYKECVTALVTTQGHITETMQHSQFARDSGKGAEEEVYMTEAELEEIKMWSALQADAPSTGEGRPPPLTAPSLLPQPPPSSYGGEERSTPSSTDMGSTIANILKQHERRPSDREEKEPRKKIAVALLRD